MKNQDSRNYVHSNWCYNYDTEKAAKTTFTAILCPILGDPAVLARTSPIFPIIFYVLQNVKNRVIGITHEFFDVIFLDMTGNANVSYFTKFHSKRKSLNQYLIKHPYSN